MKKIYQGFLFVAMMLVAIYGIGGSEGGNFFIAMCIEAVIIALMVKSGMIELPASKEEYYKHYE
jgi:hypothetical protein